MNSKEESLTPEQITLQRAQEIRAINALRRKERSSKSNHGVPRETTPVAINVTSGVSDLLEIHSASHIHSDEGLANDHKNPLTSSPGELLVFAETGRKNEQRDTPEVTPPIPIQPDGKDGETSPSRIPLDPPFVTEVLEFIPKSIDRVITQDSSPELIVSPQITSGKPLVTFGEEGGCPIEQIAMNPTVNRVSPLQLRHSEIKMIQKLFEGKALQIELGGKVRHLEYKGPVSLDTAFSTHWKYDQDFLDLKNVCYGRFQEKGYEVLISFEFFVLPFLEGNTPIVFYFRKMQTPEFIESQNIYGVVDWPQGSFDYTTSPGILDFRFENF